MSNTDRSNTDRQHLQDVAKVHEVCRDVHDAVAALAIRPLDESAALQMRKVLDSDHAVARESLRRLGAVPDPDTGEGA